MALHFQQVSLAALPANLLAAPAIAPVMWLGVLASRGGADRGAAGDAVLGAGRAAAGLRPAGRARTGATPFAVVELQRPPVVIVVGWLVAGRRGARSRCGAGAATPLGPRRAAPAARGSPSGGRARSRSSRRATRRAGPPAPGELVISFLDVGQGDATLIQLDGTAVLVDTGPPDGPILTAAEGGRDQAPRRADAHPRRDRPRGRGAAGDRARTAPRLVVDGGAGWPSPVQRTLRVAPRARIHAPAAGEVITLGALRFRVLWPPPRAASWRASGNPNDNALVTRLEANGLSRAAHRRRREPGARAADARSRSTC